MVLRSPITDSEFKAYYALRWRVLREPWNQAPGSERDDFEAKAVHLAAWNAADKLIGVGRLHRVLENCGQVRFMAVDPEQRSHGVGKAILRELEIRAIEMGIQQIRLHARQDAVQFYEKNGYHTVRTSHILFGTIPHFEMWKRLL